MNRYNLIFLIIFFTFILPGPSSAPLTSEDQYNKLQLFKSHLYDSYHHLENSTYDQNFGNLTGFKLSYQDAVDGQINQTYPLPHKDYHKWANNQTFSILPDTITGEALRIWNLENSNDQPTDSTKNYYTNISSTLYGEFSKVNNTFAKLPLQLPQYLENFNQDLSSPISPENTSPNSKIEGNITDSVGKMKINIDVIDTISKNYFNKDLDSKIKILTLDFELSNEEETNKHTIETKGFYFVESGNIITTTSSAKFFSFFGGIQHLTFNEENFNLSKNLSLSYLDQTFFKTLDPNDNIEINFNYLTQFLEKAQNHCEYVSYFHVSKVNLSKDEISNIDDELNNPIGRPIKFSEIPDLNLTGILYSPDCAIHIDVPNSSGVKREIYLHKFHKAVIAGIVLLLTQIVLILKQMNYSNTPSTISRVSFWSICLMSMVDGSLAMLYLVSSAILNKLYLPLTVSAFLAFILASIFELRFMISIYMSQLNERSINLFTALQGRPLDNADGTSNDSNTNSQAQAPEQTPTNNEPQDESQVSGVIYTRFFFTLIVFTFVMLNSAMWPKHVRKVFEYVCLIILNSYWLPQAYRNVVKGSRRSFKWWFLIGTSIVRTCPIYYVFVIKSNVFQHHYDLKFFLIITSWISIQLLILFLQEIFGARFFLPKRLLPQTYNYHPALTEADLESGFGIEHNHEHEEVATNDSSADPTTTIKNLENGHCTIDCAICMNVVELPILKSNLDQASSFLQRRSYMVTPCRHIFHSPCLEAWMKYKLQCPVCRNPLPPL